MTGEQSSLGRDEIAQQLHLFDTVRGCLAACETLSSLIETALDGARALHRAPLGNVQLLNTQGNSLAIVAQHGFGANFLRTFQEVSAHDPSVCGRALRRCQSVLVSDVNEDEDFAPFRSIAAEAGFRAVQSTPLIASDGTFVGVISTHFSEPYTPSRLDMLLLRVLARGVGDAMMMGAPALAKDIGRVTPSQGAVSVHKADEALLRKAQSLVSDRSARSERTLARSKAWLLRRYKVD